MEEVFAVTLGYVAGSIPFAFLLAHRHGIDLRTTGSGNVGAANVLRTSGVPLAVTAMVLDVMKGFVAVMLAQRLTEGPATPVAAGLAAILGHVYPIWLRFRGGKGVATAAGVFGVLTPTALAVAAGVFVVSVVVTRYISVGSVSAALALSVAAAFDDVPPAVVAGAVVAALVIVQRHRSNLARLIAGTERRIGQRT
jgi:glycerol-3-phosphate acyltransferase PlsY